MKKLFKLCLAACAMLLTALPSQAQYVSNDNEDGVYRVEKGAPRYVDGEVIVKFKDASAVNVRRQSNGKRYSLAVSSVSKVFDEIGVEDIEPLMPLTGELKQNTPRRIKSFSGKDIDIRDLSKLYVVKLGNKSNNMHESMAKIRSLSNDVEFVEPNYIASIMLNDDYDDPLFGEQTAFQEINLPQLWKAPRITSKRPVIAIIDTGVDVEHPDLKDNLWTNSMENGGMEDSDDDNNGFVDDIHGWDFVNQVPVARDNNGHGTHCAGLAGAVGNNGIGIVGANPNALIMPITVMQSDGTGDVATIIKGVDYAVANGADILSMSIGMYQFSMAMDQALARAYTNCLIVAAAGNDGHTIEPSSHCMSCMDGGMPCYPAAFTYVVGVQASYSDRLASFSNRDNSGPVFSNYTEDKLYNYETAAPGVNILSTYPGGGYKRLSGTSMACPIVAGALSCLLDRKELASKEVLFGDFIHAGRGFYPDKAFSFFDVNATYEMKDTDRRPELEFVAYEMQDAIGGDGDGRYDAGEIIEIYPTIRNLWGQADNIKFSIELANENEDKSIVEFITPAIDSFKDQLSGYAKVKSEMPVKFRISDKCVDGRHIQLRLRATCDNCAQDAVGEFTISVENGVELGGMAIKDMTLVPDVHYIVSSLFGIPEGVTVTVMPGTVLKIKDGAGISVGRGGKFICHGTKEHPITITKADLDLGDNAGLVFPDDYSSEQKNDTIKYTIFENMNYENTYSNLGSALGYVVLENCVCRNNYSSRLGFLCTFIKSNAYNNSYRNDGGSNFMESNVVNNNIIIRLNEEMGLKCKSSNIFSNFYSDDLQLNVLVYRSVLDVLYNDNPNYWGTAVEKTARRGIWDMVNPISPYGFGYYDLSNMLTRPNPQAHGIVWKVLCDGVDAQDDFSLLSPLGVGTHKFEVYYNSPMNTAIAPTITMGVRPPYTQNVIAENGSWNETGDVYTAYLTLTGKSMTDGLCRIRVSGGQDNEYFDVPEEQFRFNVNVQVVGSLSTGLVAKAGLGKVELEWETDEADFADLMGYNLYRYNEREEKYIEWGKNDNGEWGNWEKTRILVDTIMVNKMLIDPSETTLTDYNVEPGTTYYYYIMEMGTDLKQHDVSKVVAATPLTATKGDANGSMNVDIADVVTEVNYLTGQNPQPFIFEAADVNSDETVNILDVVGTVNIIITPKGAATASTDAKATYTVENGILYVDSDTPLGGVQVSIKANANTVFEALEGLDGMEQAGVWVAEDEYMLLAYSMSGRVIGSGKQPLMRIGDAEVTDVVASDAKGHNVLAINGTATSIANLPFGIEDYEGAEVRYYDLTGRRMSTEAASKSGVAIQSLFIGGKCVKSYKILNR